MKTLKYRVRLGKGEPVTIPADITKEIDDETELEVVVRQVVSPKIAESNIPEIVTKLERQMNEEFPNLKKTLSRKILEVAGVSDRFYKNFSKYSDKEILGMLRMEKYMEKGEIIESLY